MIAHLVTPRAMYASDHSSRACAQVSTAKTILLTPELRRKYELGGMDALDEAALQEAGIQVRAPPALCTCAVTTRAHQLWAL